MTDAIATRDGYTQEVVLANWQAELYLLVKPGTDLGERFKAWDTDNQEFILVNGWLFSVEDAM